MQRGILIIKPALPSESSIAFDLLKDAAIWLQSKNINYWQSWLNPGKTYIKWVQDGFKNNEFYFVYLNKKRVGMFRLQWRDDIFWGTQNDNAGYIHSLTTVREYYGQGLGFEILQQIEIMCIKKDKSYLRLDCGSHLPKLHKFYENFGFTPAGKTMTMGEDLILFEKQIITP